MHKCFVTGKGGMRMTMERTYIMAKPDALQRGIVSDIIGRFGALGGGVRAVNALHCATQASFI